MESYSFFWVDNFRAHAQFWFSDFPGRIKLIAHSGTGQLIGRLSFLVSLFYLPPNVSNNHLSNKGLALRALLEGSVSGGTQTKVPGISNEQTYSSNIH